MYFINFSALKSTSDKVRSGSRRDPEVKFVFMFKKEKKWGKITQSLSDKNIDFPKWRT